VKEPSYDYYLQQQQWAYEDEQIELEELEEEEEEPDWLTDPNNVMSRHHY
jgi:hypothetical protein